MIHLEGASLQHRSHYRVACRRLAVATCALAPLLSTGSQAQVDSTRIQLREGVVVDRAAGAAYIMSPDTSISAVDLARGTMRWKTKVASKPLVLADNTLVAQVEPTAATRNQLRVVTLHTRNRGEQISAGTSELPPGVRVSTVDTFKSSFDATATRLGGDVLIPWEHVDFPSQGIRPRDTVSSGVALTQARPRSAPVVTRGVLRMSRRTGALSTAGEALVPPPRESMLQRVSTGEKLTGGGPSQFASADGRHIVTTEGVADDRVWDKYRWTVTERSSGQCVGVVRSHVAIAPFFVYGPLIIYPTTPYLRTDGGEQPSKLRAFDLRSGAEAWSVALRETKYRGPVPP